jgi:hypothetical protein
MVVVETDVALDFDKIIDSEDSHLVFESPVAATGKKPQPGRTESQKTGPPVAVFTGCESVAVAVF